jgi:hypothetical protein
MSFDFLAKGFLPVLAGLRGKIGLLKKLQAKGTAQIGDGGDTLGKLSDGIVKRRIVGSGRKGGHGKKHEGKQNQQKEIAEQGTVKKWLHGVLKG